MRPRRIFEPWRDKLEFEYTSDRSIEEILQLVASLPPRSIVIYCNVFADKTGRTFTPLEVGKMVAKAANAPVFCLWDTLLGSGAIGGSLLSFEAEGAYAGNVALDILNGKILLTKPVTTLTTSKTFMFDWQQLKRWGASEVNLPKESIFLNRSPSFWDQYKSYVIGVVVFLLAQSILIILLLLQIRQRKKAEEELKEYSERLEEKVQQRTAELTKSNEQLHSEIRERMETAVGLRASEERYHSLFSGMTEGFALHEIICDENGEPSDYRFLEINPAFERLTGLKREEVVGKTMSQILPDDDPNWVKIYGEVALTGKSIHFDNYSPMLKRHYEVYAYCPAPRQFGVLFMDITERKEAEEVLRRHAVELQRLTETLEQRVQTRTEELEKANRTLQELSSRLLSAQEDERKRIAGELHDTIGSCLSGVKYKIENVLQQFGKDSNVTEESLTSVIPVIQEGIEECRRMQQDLRPSLLDDLGLLPTLSWFCRRYQTIYTGIKVDLEQTLEERDIPDSLKIVIFRVTQEGMNNIAKHSKADLVHLSLRKMDGRIELVLEDNGQGFDLKKVLGSESTKRGLGLTSMRERTELSGGSFAIESAEGKGTTIHVSWPLGEEG